MSETLNDQIAAFARYATGSGSERAAATLRDTVARLRDEGLSDAEITEDPEVVGMLARLRASVPVPS